VVINEYYNKIISTKVSTGVPLHSDLSRDMVWVTDDKQTPDLAEVRTEILRGQPRVTA
jgi:hypothetical protein